MSYKPVDIRQAFVSLELVDEMWLEFEEHNVELGNVVVEGHIDTIVGYMERYWRVSCCVKR